MSAPLGWSSNGTGEPVASASSYEPWPATSPPYARRSCTSGVSGTIASAIGRSAAETMTAFAPQSETMYAASSAVRWLLTAVM